MAYGSDHTFLQRIYTNGQKVHKKCSMSVVIKEMQIHTTMRYPFIPIRLAIRKGISDDQDVENWNPCTLLVVIQNGAVAIENSVEFPQKVKNRTVA